MQIEKMISNYQKKHKVKKRIISCFLVLALLVGTVVSLQLHVTGISMTNEVQCGKEEHTHTEDCYQDGELACGKEEHIHTVDCMSDQSADVETENDWKQTLPDNLTGTWAEDLVNVAVSQLGYKESTKNFILSEDGATRKGYTRYGAWYGNEYGDWDAMFVSFCLYYADIPSTNFIYSAGSQVWKEKLTALEMYQDVSAYTPKKGDVIFLKENAESADTDQVGIVESVDESKITVIQGDTEDSVERQEYALNDSRISGYGVLPENPELQKKETSESGIVEEENQNEPADESQNMAENSPMTVSDATTPDIPNKTSVTVKKKWKGGLAARPDSVTIHLYQNGQAYGEPIQLNSDNKWTDQIDDLPYCSDDGTPYEYTVSEDEVPDFFTSYSEKATIPDASSGDHYLNRGTLTEGASYVMVCQDVVITSVLDKNGKNVKFTGNPTVTSDKSVTYDGITYQGEITEDVPDGNRWTIQQNSDGSCTFKCGEYTLYHKEDGNPYLATKPTNTKKDSSSYFMDSKGRIYCKKKDGKPAYIKADIDRNGTFKNIGRTDKENDAASFTFYEEVYVVGAHERYEYTVTNSYNNEDGGSGNVVVKGNKSIDYLGDGGSNPDTQLTGEEFYRQYLSVQGKGEAAVDFLFVVDNTGSMTSTFGTVDGVKLSRDKTVSKILNGSYNGTATEEGLITQVLRGNPNNHAAVITFCGRGTGGTYEEGLVNEEVITQMNWTTLGDDTVAPYADVLYHTGGGTCYEVGVLRAEEMLQQDAVKDNGNPKVIVFLGDGEPNGFLQNASGKAANAEELADKAAVTFNWRGSSEAYQGTKNATDYLVNNVDPNTKIYSISVGYDVSGEADVLGYMAEKGQGEKYTAYDISQTVAAFRQIISNYYPSRVSVSDNLSQYAELYTDQLDFQITRELNGQKTVIWKGSLKDDGTIGSSQNGGSSYIQSVSYTKGNGTDSTGKVDITFQPTYILESDVKYEISYNLKVTDTAKTTYEKSNYDATGDAGTDYAGNATSSGKQGFHSNQSAGITYTEGGAESIKLYPHPVLQVKSEPKTTSLTVQKMVSGAETDESFQFKAELSEGSFPAPEAGATYTIDENGAAVFSLKNGETVTLAVPNNVKATITEIKHDGYETTIKRGGEVIANGDSVSVDIATDPVGIEVINTAGYKLPESGGTGTLPYTLGGAILMIVSLMYGYSRKQKYTKGGRN